MIERFEPQELQAVEHMETTSSALEPAHPSPTANQRQGRSDRRMLTQKQVQLNSALSHVEELYF